MKEKSIEQNIVVFWELVNLSADGEEEGYLVEGNALSLYPYIDKSICTHAYIYIEREREGGRERDGEREREREREGGREGYIYNTHTYTCIHIYMYVYI